MLCLEGCDDGWLGDDLLLETDQALHWIAPALLVLVIHNCCMQCAVDLEFHPAIRELCFMPLLPKHACREAEQEPWLFDVMGPDTIGSLTALRKLKVCASSGMQPFTCP